MTTGVLMISAADVLSGSTFLARPRVARSRSVTTPTTFFHLSQIGRKPTPASAITAAACRTVSFSFSHSRFLLMMSAHFMTALSLPASGSTGRASVIVPGGGGRAGSPRLQVLRRRRAATQVLRVNPEIRAAGARTQAWHGLWIVPLSEREKCC